MKPINSVGAPVRHLRVEEVLPTRVVRDFERLLPNQKRREKNESSGNDENGQNEGRRRPQDKSLHPIDGRGSRRVAGVMPRDVLQLFQESLRHSVAAESASGAVLHSLIRDIADAFQAGRRVQGDRWRLVMRLREELLRQTNLELACNGGELSVTLRTSDTDAYHCLVNALPELNETLERRGWGQGRAAVFWVNPEELE